MAAPMSGPPPAQEHDNFRWWALGVLLLVCTSVGIYTLRHGPGELPELGAMCVAVWLSKLSIFGGSFEGLPLSPWSLGLIAWELDVLASALLLLWVDRIERLPLVGPAVRRAHAHASDALVQYPGLRRMAVAGVTFFIFLPLPGSGAVGGTLIGQLVGLSRVAGLLTMIIGAGLICIAYALAADFFGSQWPELLESPRMLILSVVVLLLFSVLAWRYVKRVLSKA
jgi:uncharacterized membrane protein